MKNTFTKISSLAVVFAMAFGFQVAMAAAPQNASDNMTRQKIATLSDHVINFDLPTILLSGETIAVTLPAAFTGTGATTSTDWAVAGNVATYTAPSDQAVATSYSLELTGFINPAVLGNQSITIVASNGDTGSILVPIIIDDQIKITARVAQTLYFDVRDGTGTSNTATDNTVGFGDLEATNVNYATDDATGIATTPTTSS